MNPVDYNGPIHRQYHASRALSAAQSRTWLTAFADVLPATRPLAGLDLGSGTGRFSPLLADAFGPVTGVEPSDAMRAVATRESAHPDVRYVSGSATAIPANDAAFDYCLMFLSWHHVTDKHAAAQEIARVLRPNGILLVRTQFSDHMPDLWWLRHFPGGPALDASMYLPMATEIETFAAAGFTATPGVLIVVDPSPGTKAQRLAQLERRPYSLFEHMSPQQVETGFAALRRAVAADPHSTAPDTQATLLVMTRQRDCGR